LLSTGCAWKRKFIAMSAEGIFARGMPERSRTAVFYLTRSAAKRKDYLDLTPGPPPVPPPNFPPHAFLAAQCLVADVVGDRR